MQFKLKTLVFGAIVVLSIPGVNAQNLSGSGYDVGQARAETNVSAATVVRVRDIMLDKSSTSGGVFGGVLGGVVGAAVGSQVGGGAGKTLATLLLGATGAAVGNGIANANAQVKGWEIVVKGELTGRMVAITQEADGYQFVAGQSVLVLDRGGVMRVTPAQ